MAFSTLSRGRPDGCSALSRQVKDPIVSEIRRPQRPIAEVVLRWLANDNRGNRLVYFYLRPTGTSTPTTWGESICLPRLST